MKNLWILSVLISQIAAQFQELVVNATRLKRSSIYDRIEKFFETWDTNEGIYIQDFNRGKSINLINHYQIRDNQLYRAPWCKLLFRCMEIEYFISENLHQLPDMDFLVNIRDNPISMKREYTYDSPLPVLSPFSNDRHHDIMYPSFAFWNGGIGLQKPTNSWTFPEEHKEIVTLQPTNWDDKLDAVYFRGEGSDLDFKVLKNLKEGSLFNNAAIFPEKINRSIGRLF